MSIESGVYVGLPEEKYHADSALGSSGVKLLLQSPAKYWSNSPLNPDRENDDNPAFKFGRAYHKLILEPEKFEAAFQIKKGVKTTKEEGMLGEAEYETLMKMRSMLVRHPKQLAVLSGGIAEVSIFFDYEYEGKKTRCKVRFDMFAPHWVADLKTASDISRRAMFYQFGDFGYDISGAMYSIGAKALKKMLSDGYKMPPEFDQKFIDSFVSHDEQIFAFIFQEKSSPYLTRGLCMTPWISDVGRDKFHKALGIYHENIGKEGIWPSGYEDIEDIDESMISERINYF